MSIATLTPPVASVTPSSLLDSFRQVCATTDSRNPEAMAGFCALRDEAVRAIMALPAKLKQGPEVEAACALVEAFVDSSLYEPATTNDLAWAQTCLASGWPGTLAAFLLAPAWQLEAVPKIESLPSALRPTLYFKLPALLTQPGQADAILHRYCERLRELVKLAEANPGAQRVRAATDAYALAGDFTLLANSTQSLHELLSLRGRLTSILQRAGRRHEVAIAPRSDRRLRVGFVIEALNPTPQVRAALPWFEHLDDQRFETTVLTLRPSFSELGAHVASKHGEPHILGIDVTAAVQKLREESYDALVFFTRVTENGDPTTAIAAHRSAPLQVVLDEARLTTGLANADLTVVDASQAEASAQYSERIAVMPACGVPLLPSVVKPKAEVEWTRAGLDLPADAVVFASLAPFRNLTWEWVDAVARLLAEVPTARLVVHSADPFDESAPALDRMFRVIEPIMSRRGVTFDRVILSNEKFPSVSELIALLKIADFYVDTSPLSQTEGVQLALEAGIPVLTCESPAEKPGCAARWMLDLGLDKCVAEDLPALVATAKALAGDASDRIDLRQQLQASLTQLGNCFDPVAFAEAFGLVLEKAFDEVVARGKPGFGSKAPPITVASAEEVACLTAEASSLLDLGLSSEAALRINAAIGSQPANPAVRELWHQSLAARYQHQRVADSLLSFVERHAGDAGAWHRLGEALIAAGNRTDGVKALETSLRIDANNLEAWKKLSAIATESGNFALAAEVAEVIDNLTSAQRPEQQLGS